MQAKFILIMAYILDLIFADPYNMPHPVKYMGKLISYLEKKFLSTNLNKFFGGIIIFFITVFSSYFITYTIINLSYKIDNYLAISVQIILMYTILAAKCLELEALKVFEKVKDKDLQQSRKQLSYIVGRDTENLSFPDIIRATIETVAENIVDAIISPIFFFVIGGVPLAMAFKAVSTLDSMIGYRNEKYEKIGKFSARADDICNFIPARLSVFFFPLASFINSLDTKNCIKIGFRDKNNHLSPNCAYPEAFMAGALGLKLGGANYYFGKLVEKQSIGDDIKNPDEKDIIKSVKMLRTITIISVIVAYFAL